MMRRHMSRVVLWKIQCMFTLSHLSRAQFRLNKNSWNPEHATLAAIAPMLVKVGCTTVSIHSKKGEIEVLDAAL